MEPRRNLEGAPRPRCTTPTGRWGVGRTATLELRGGEAVAAGEGRTASRRCRPLC